MADDEQKVLAAARQLPLAERLAHGNWKVRSEGLDDIKQACSRAFGSQDKVFAEAGPLLPKAVGDANANVMDKALEALGAFLEKANEDQAARIAGPTSSTIAAKALKARPSTVAKATEACLLFVELEQQEAVMEGIAKAFGDKVAKVVTAALDIVKQAVSLFGTKVVEAKPLLAKLPAVFGNSNAGVRDKAKEVVLELAGYLGPGPIQGALLDKIPEAVKKALEGGLAELPAARRKPERFTRREQALRAQQAEAMDVDVEAPAEAAGGAGPAAVEDSQSDAWEYATPVDILSALGKSTIKVGDDSVAFWDCFESKKWNVRKGALDALKEAARVMRLAPAEYNDLVRELKKILAKDANIACAAAAAEASGLLAAGLRIDFVAQARSLCPAIIERFKEKNIVMSKAAEEALRLMGEHCYTPVDVADDLVAGMVHKNPKARLDTAKLVKDSLEQSPKAVVIKCKDSLLPVAAAACSDADASIREVAQGIVAVFAVKAGSMAIIDKHLNAMDDARKKKIEEMVQAAAKAAPPATAPGRVALPAASAPSRQASASSAPSSSRDNTKAPLAPKNGTSGRVGAAAAAPKAAPAARRPGTSARGPSGSGGAVADDDEGSLSAGKLSKEELDEQMQALFGGAVVEQLRSAKWQERVEGMDAVSAAVRGLDDLHRQCSVLVQCVAHLPGFSDKNFQVLNKEFELLSYLAQQSATFSKRDGFVAMEGLAEKIHELKHKGPVCEALTAVSEAVGPQFVLTQLHKRAGANKNPKVLAEALGWMAQAVEEFGLGALNVMAIIDWMKADLGSANAPVRNKAMDVLGKCHAQLGQALVGFLDGLKPAQMTALEEHFRQNPKTEVVPTRKVRSAKPKAAAAAGGGGATGGRADEEEEAAGPVNVEDLLPRVDISGSITPMLLTMISSSNWKERNAGVDGVANILAEAGNRIAPGVGDLFGALKGRMADSNRNLAAKTLCLLGDIATAMGPPFDKQARPLLALALANLSDNKKQVRDGVVYMLDAWLAVAGADKLFPAVAEAVVNPKCIIDGKVAGLSWMTKMAAEGKARRALDSALKAAAAGAQDKAVNVREAANALVAELVASAGSEAVAQGAAALGGSEKKAALELITKVAGAPASSSVPAAPSRPGTAASSATAAASSRLATSRPATSRVAQAPPPAARPTTAPASAEQAGPILVTNEGKAERARRFRPRPGKFDGVNAEELDNLQRELAAVASPEFHALLFHKDFKRHLEAADAVVAALPELLEVVAANLDLLLRWAVLRICDGNMQSLVRVLEMCRTLLEALVAAGYQLSEYEATILLPAVVEKSGHNQDRVRALHRDVLRICCSLHPSSRVADHLTHGLASKSNRTKIECCEEIGCIIEREGMEPIHASRARPVQAVAGLLKERDGATRAAALAAIEQAWVEESDEIWKLLGRLDTREKDMVEEKFKRSSRQPRARRALPQPAPQPVEEPPRPGAFVPRAPVAAAAAAVAAEAGPSHGPLSTQGLGAAASPAGSDDAPQYHPLRARAFTPPNAMETPLPPRTAATSYALPSSSALGVPTPVPAARPHSTPPALAMGEEGPGDDASFDEHWALHLVGISSPNINEAVEHMKQLCAYIMAATEDRASRHARSVMGASAQQMFAMVNRQLLLIFQQAEEEARLLGTQPQSRGCKYALNVMLQGMAVPEIARGLPQSVLRDNISLLLMRLLDDKGLLQFEEGPTLVKAVNVLMLKMLETSNRTYAFGALLQLLREPPGDVTPEMLPKFHDLVVKCLIKLTKSLQMSMEGVDLTALLVNIHDFFLFLGVDEIRKRSSSDDKPLRMVKTILHELCKVCGYGIYQHTATIPGRDADPPSDQPIIFVYISLNLQTLSQSGLIEGEPAEATGATAAAAASATAANGTAGAGEAAGSGWRPPAPGLQMTEADKARVKAALKDIMSRLVQREHSATATRELYFLRSEHPAYVDKYIATTSDLFQNFIRDGLAQLDTQGAEPGPPSAAGPSQPRSLLQRPTISPSTSEAYLPAAAVSPGSTSAGSVRSENSATRLSALRERMGQMRTSGEGAVVPAPVSARSAGDLSAMRLSIEDLQARMQNLRRISQPDQ